MRGSGPELPEVVRTYFDALNAEDFERLAGIWSDDAEVSAVGARPRTGREDVMNYYGRLFEPWAEHEDRPERAVAGDSAVFVEIVFTGTTRAGKELTFPAVDVFDIEGGAIRKLAIYYDLTWVRKQLQ